MRKTSSEAMRVGRIRGCHKAADDWALSKRFAMSSDASHYRGKQHGIAHLHARFLRTGSPHAPMRWMIIIPDSARRPPFARETAGVAPR